ncbi:hypothetical protein AVEN_55358-1 [Araneus ventricosus]|uniref:Uncharacterized protein n=1 Tax=Araneus ventricosus TaxID=182803 RepID=A0A4Y2DCC3_ARAVE|nr:hypothetical protein AVEN_55358-1 [Araneus ventricosus]
MICDTSNRRKGVSRPRHQRCDIEIVPLGKAKIGARQWLSLTVSTVQCGGPSSSVSEHSSADMLDMGSGGRRPHSCAYADRKVVIVATAPGYGYEK